MKDKDTPKKGATAKGTTAKNEEKPPVRIPAGPWKAGKGKGGSKNV